MDPTTSFIFLLILIFGGNNADEGFDVEVPCQNYEKGTIPTLCTQLVRNHIFLHFDHFDLYIILIPAHLRRPNKRILNPQCNRDFKTQAPELPHDQ
jgi:hypothetical protein